MLPASGRGTTAPGSESMRPLLGSWRTSEPARLIIRTSRGCACFCTASGTTPSLFTLSASSVKTTVSCTIALAARTSGRCPRKHGAAGTPGPGAETMSMPSTAMLASRIGMLVGQTRRKDGAVNTRIKAVPLMPSPPPPKRSIATRRSRTSRRIGRLNRKPGAASTGPWPAQQPPAPSRSIARRGQRISRPIGRSSRSYGAARTAAWAVQPPAPSRSTVRRGPRISRQAGRPSRRSGVARTKTWAVQPPALSRSLLPPPRRRMIAKRVTTIGARGGRHRRRLGVARQSVADAHMTAMPASRHRVRSGP
mmetsp:Transcript_89583/g.253508  ORF Transcript_89583/g.253508 Transcript_89583/m.253508 type:complete len:308 (+) Transcript_89583:261-1184(+)